MSIIKECLENTKKWQTEYGAKTVVFTQIGSFLEVYSLLNADGTYTDNTIQYVAQINDMVIASKNIFVDGKQVVMAGVGMAYIDKYIKKLQEHNYTIVIYKQDINAKNTTRSLSEIISPGTFFSPESEELSNNVMSIWLHKSAQSKYAASQVSIGVANIDIFTGKTSLFQFSADYNHNPSTYDELERYISAYKPSECLLVANMPEKVINDIIGFVGLQNSKIHKVDLSDDEIVVGCRINPKGNTINPPQTTMQTFAKNAEKQIYQQAILKKFYPHIMDQAFFQAFPTHFIATQAFCFLLDFVHQHSPNLTKRLAEPVFENYTDKLVLANHSLYQLNIIDDSRHTGKLRSVSSLLNNCVTTMGKRHFLYNLHNPTTNPSLLNASYDVTEHLLSQSEGNNNITWSFIRSKLTGIKDIEKLNRKLVMNKIIPKDFALLANDLQLIADLYEKTVEDSLLTRYIDIPNNIQRECNEILTDLNRVFSLEKCLGITDINGDVEVFINKGVSPIIDALVKESVDGREKLEAIRKYFSDIIKISEKTVKETQYIKIHETPKNDAVLMGTSRRMGFVKKHLASLNQPVSISYISKYSQYGETFAFNVEDLTYNSIGSNKTDLIVSNSQIKELTNIIQNSREKIVKEMLLFFNNYVNNFIKFEPHLSAIVKYTTVIDMIQCKCYIAGKYNYCKPVIQQAKQEQAKQEQAKQEQAKQEQAKQEQAKQEQANGKAFLSFTGIRHPLIEHLQSNELYVTNDLSLGIRASVSSDIDADGILLYGTNAVGKTSFIKSIGIALIMAQAGLYVPAGSFTYSPYNYIFTRILGNDNIFKGLSTFAVEMSELRTILKVADENSLVLGDELCSGTESDSALSIFTAGLEILHQKQCTFLFATHFHEINTYEEIKALTRLKMLHMAVNFDRERNALVYDRKLREGPGESMYGLEVCKSLNLPDDFLKRAHDIRMKYNAKDKNVLALKTSHFNSQKIVGMCELCNNEPASEVHHLQHQTNAKLENDYIENKESGQSFHKNHIANLLNICDKCHKHIHKTGKQHKVKKTSKKYELGDV
jgi:DNA mismatch repair protein MutS